SSRVQAVVDHFGPTDFFHLASSHTTATSPESFVVGFWIQETLNNIPSPAFAAKDSALERISSLTFSSPYDPPYHTAPGPAHPVVLPSQSQTLSDALTAVGVPNTLTYIEGAGHGLPPTEELAARNFLVGTLNVVPCPGDTNGDRVVNTSDLTAMLAVFGN